MTWLSFQYGYDETRVTDIQILSVEGRGSKVFINFAVAYAEGDGKTLRIEARRLADRFDASRIREVVCLGRVHCGLIKSDHRLLFIVSLWDGTKRLLQQKEGSHGCNQLLQMEALPR